MSNPYQTAAVNPRLRLERVEPDGEYRWAYYRRRVLGVVPISLALKVDSSQRPWLLIGTGRQKRTPATRITWSGSTAGHGHT